MKRLVSILVWSAISAAFIGPGTVTTASAAGAGFGYSLLWALIFSTVACFALQDASARLTIVTGKPLARAMGEGFGRGRAGRIVPALVVGSVVLGCAAFQAGNILGAVAGATLQVDIPPRVITLVAGLIAGAILFAGTPQALARILGLVVAIMGVAFLVCAFQLKPDMGSLLKGSFVPTLPAGSGMVVLGLVGTTVVPYNLFLGSGLAKGQSLSEARFGMAVAIPLGGLISMAILVVGTAVQGDLTFAALSNALESRLGAWVGMLFAFGLFFAGFSSALTAPLAAALSIQGFAARENNERWDVGSARFRAVWGLVLAFGLIVGLTEIKPIPVILLAQALNGAILPVVALFLMIAVNDRRLMGAEGLASPCMNVMIGFSVIVALLLGASGILKAVYSCAGLSAPDEITRLAVAGVLVAVVAAPVIKQIKRRRSAT